MNAKFCLFLSIICLNSACSGKKAPKSVPNWAKSELLSPSFKWIPDNADLIVIFDPVNTEASIKNVFEKVMRKIHQPGNVQFSTITSSVGVFYQGKSILWMIRGLEEKNDNWRQGFRGFDEITSGNRCILRPEKNMVFSGNKDVVYHSTDVYTGKEKGSGKNWLRISRALSSLSWIKKLPVGLAVWTPESPGKIVSIAGGVYFSGSWMNLVGVLTLKSASDSDEVINKIKVKVINFSKYGIYTAGELMKLLKGLSVHGEGNRVYIQYAIKTKDLQMLLKPAVWAVWDRL
ncbi:hypothetical protein KKF34_18295 [Myxococcota bacterium]|nr:hypothetical protein [Myxococcota bacterium]MBU1383010.1 hypothetical protein [Myxococcota bacterium]MBU1498835.1 hypothetical protein [Myxococcota bacterium]